MLAERLRYEIDAWHKAQGAARKPHYWPIEATVCAIPQEHDLTTHLIKCKGQKTDLLVHRCTKCSFSLSEPVAKTTKEE